MSRTTSSLQVPTTSSCELRKQILLDSHGSRPDNPSFLGDPSQKFLRQHPIPAKVFSEFPLRRKSGNTGDSCVHRRALRQQDAPLKLVLARSARVVPEETLAFMLARCYRRREKNFLPTTPLAANTYCSLQQLQRSRPGHSSRLEQVLVCKAVLRADCLTGRLTSSPAAIVALWPARINSGTRVLSRRDESGP